MPVMSDAVLGSGSPLSAQSTEAASTAEGRASQLITSFSGKPWGKALRPASKGGLEEEFVMSLSLFLGRVRVFV